MTHSERNTAQELLTASQAAKLLDVSRKTVYRWSETGQLPVAEYTSGGHRRFSRQAVIDCRRAADDPLFPLRTAIERYEQAETESDKKGRGFDLQLAVVALAGGKRFTIPPDLVAMGADEKLIERYFRVSDDYANLGRTEEEIRAREDYKQELIERLRRERQEKASD